MYDPGVNQTAELYLMMKVNTKSKAVRDKTGRQSQILWCKNVATSKHENFNLVFTNHGTEDEIYPLKRDSKAQDKDQRSIVQQAKHLQRSCVFSLLKT